MDILYGWTHLHRDREQPNPSVGNENSDRRKRKMDIIYGWAHLHTDI